MDSRGRRSACAPKPDLYLGIQEEVEQPLRMRRLLWSTPQLLLLFIAMDGCTCRKQCIHARVWALKGYLEVVLGLVVEGRLPLYSVAEMIPTLLNRPGEAEACASLRRGFI